MKYEKTSTPIHFSARFQAAFNDAHAVEEAAFFLKHRAKGPWHRQGSSLFLNTLDDAFHVRLYFSESLKTLRESQAYQAPEPNAVT